MKLSGFNFSLDFTSHRERIRTLTISIRFCLFRVFLPVCLRALKRDGAKVGTGRQMKADGSACHI